MASKLFAPFKNIPQQLSKFKKSADKFKDVSMSNYNCIFGMLDDVTCNSFDNELYLLALGTKRGEIKIFGSPGLVYTLVNSPLKSVHLLKFLDGQGRLIAVSNDNEIVMWEFKTDTSTWEVVSTINFSSLIPNGRITSVDVSRSLSWKSDSDDLLELLLVGSSTNTIYQILIIGSRFHLYDGDDLLVDTELILSKCPELDKEYEFGEIDQIHYHPSNNENFLVSFTKGLILVIDNKVATKEVKEDKEEKANQNEVVEEKVEKEAEPEEAKPAEEVNEEEKKKDPNGENEVIEKQEEVKTETEKEKAVEEIKVEPKKIKESTQVPYAYVQKPMVVNYLQFDKKINSVSWFENKITVISEDSCSINTYETNDNNVKISEPQKTVSLPENFSTGVSKFVSLNTTSASLGTFIAQIDDKQHFLVVMKDDKVFAEIETPSNIIDYTIVRGQTSTNVTDNNHLQPLILLILCESQLIAIDLECENLTEIQCPYLMLKNTCQITSLTNVIQVPALIFPNAQTVNEVFKDWPLKSAVLPSEKVDEETLIDVMVTGHADGSINIWQLIQSGVLCLLTRVESHDLHSETTHSNAIKNENTNRKQAGHRLIELEESLLQITNIHLTLHCSNSYSESLPNELYCVVGNASGTVFVFKYDGSDTKENLVEISSEFDKDGMTWMDSDAPELINRSDINEKLPKLNYIIRLSPSFPITSLTLQPSWDLLGIGCTYGLALVDLRSSKCVFSHLTIQRASKNNSAVQPPLTVGQQLKKSIRQSFRKLKKLKPAAKHTYTVNEEKPKEKEEAKPTEKEEEKESAKTEDNEEVLKESQPNAEDGEVNEEKVKENKETNEENDTAVVTNENNLDVLEAEAVTIEVSRKDRPITAVGSLLLVNTSLTSSNKIPCLFAGTNIGSVFAFEISMDDETTDSVTVKLSKELHLQHKAPILLLSVTNANHVPLLSSTDQIGTHQRKFKTSNETKTEEEINSESKASEGEIGPSGDSDNKEDAKQKSGTLPSSTGQEDVIEPTDGARRSVDSSKDKINLTNVNMKKSGTLPASFLQAIGKSQGSSDSHELLVVSEEQVKLFSLPSLKAKHKYKVVDTGHIFSHSKATSSQETEQSQDKKNETRISSVGLCKVRSLKSSNEKWSVSIALTNGEIVVLHISNLKKYFSNVFNSSGSMFTGISNGELNLVISHAHKYNIQITDFSQNSVHRYEPYVNISIPKSARPVIHEKVEAESKANGNIDEVKPESEPVVTEAVVNGHHDIVNGHDEDEEKDQIGDEAVVQNTSSVHHGDITMDSIKEYITNPDGNITIKTIEITKEKQISVDGGQIVTTIHEKQIKDGEVVKDDVVKITSDTRVSNDLSLKE